MNAASVATPYPLDAGLERCGELDRQLHQILGFNVHAPEALIEDACQTAWLRLARCGDCLAARAVLSWLVTTATREALRLLRQCACEVPFEELADPQPMVSPVPGPEMTVELRARLSELRALTERQRRLIWLQGLGFSYDEMAAREGASLRTIERQLLRARSRLRSGSEADVVIRPEPARARESDPRLARRS